VVAILDEVETPRERHSLSISASPDAA